MARTTGPRFINGPEAQQIFAGLAGVDISNLPVTTKFKVWPGVCFGIYKYKPNVLNPVLIDKLKLIHMGVEKHGPLARLVSLVGSLTYEVSVYPTMLIEDELAVSFPQRTYFERTIQEYSEGDRSISIAACIQAHHQQRPDWASEDVPFMDMWFNIQNKFTDASAFRDETERMRKGVSIA